MSIDVIPNTWTNIDSVDNTNIYTGLSVSSDGKTAISSSSLTTKISNDYGITWNPLTTIQVANGFGNSFGLPSTPYKWCPFQQAMSATGQYIVLVAFDTYTESSKGLVFYSNNYGKTFTQSTGLPTSSCIWRAPSISSSGQYVVVFNALQTPVMYYSYDYGASFTSAVTTASGYFLNNSCISDDGLTVVMTSPAQTPNTKSVFIGKYIGTSWTWTLSNPGGSFFSTNGCAMNSTASTIYIGSNALYRSTDSGFTWTNLNGTLGLPTGTQTWFIAMTRDGTRIIAAKNNVTDSTGGVYLSTNSGASFSVMPGLPTINTQWDTLAISTDGRYMAAGYGFGSTQSSPFYYSFDSGVTWNAYSSGLNINSVCIQNSVLLFTTGNYADAAIASNVYIASLLPLTATAISSSGKNAVGFIKGERIYYSDTNGQTWIPATTQPTSSVYNWSSISIDQTGKNALLCENSGYIFYSDTSGQSWRQSSVSGISTAQNWTSISISGTNSIACIKNGKIYYSSNSGINFTVSDSIISNWNSVSISNNGPATAIDISNVYYSINYGMNWTISNLKNLSNIKSVSISESGTYALTTATANNIYYSDTSGQTWKSYNNQNNWSNSVLSRDGTYGLATADNKLYTLSLITPTTFPQPALHYPFNISDTNFNNQLQDWSSGSPVYNANMNTSYISKTNYKTGVGSLELPKNSISSIGTLYNLFTVTGSIGIAVSQNQLKLVTCSLTTGSGKLQYSTRATTSDSYGALAQVQGTPTGGYSRVVLTSDGTRGIYCFGWAAANSNYVYFFTWTGAAPSIPIQTLDTTLRDYYGLAITPDGSRLVASTSTSVFFAVWNGSNYTAFTQTLEIVTAQLMGIGISTNGDRIVYGTGANTITWYISFWNGTNYNTGKSFRTITPGYAQNANFSADSSLIFLSYAGNATSIEYGKYNPTTNTYDTFTSVTSVGASQNIHGLCYIELNTTGNLYYANHSAGVLYMLQFNYATAQTTNYVNMNTSNFNSVYTLSTSVGGTYIIGVAVSSDQLKMVVCFHENRNVYYATRTNTNLPWSSFTVIPGSSTANWYRISLIPDGTRGAVCSSNTGYVFMFTWTGAAPAAPAGWAQTLDTTSRVYVGVSLTADGSRMVISVNSGTGIYFSSWNGSNYSAFTASTANTGNCMGVAVSANGDRIVFGNSSTSWYISFWNGTNYPASTVFRTAPSGITRTAFLSQDSSLLFLSYVSNTSCSVEYGTYVDGQTGASSYTGFTQIQTSVIPASLDIHALCYVANNTIGTIYAAGYNTSTMYIVTESQKPFMIGNNGFTFSTWFRSNFNNTWARIFDFGNAAGVENILLANYNNNLVLSIYRGTAVASQQTDLLSAYPINDYKWYHIAFSLSYIGSNSPTANLIVYLNGQVISNINNYTYPLNIQRTLNYIGKSNWGDPQFFGSIDDFRFYNSVLSGGQIQHIYINTPIINSFLDHTKLSIYLLGNTSVDKANATWGTVTNMGTGYTYYYWNDPYAQTNAYLNYSNPIIYSYTYTASSAMSSVKLYVMCDDICKFKLNSSSIVLASTGWNITVSATTINLISGNNIFEFECTNTGGPAMFAAYVTDIAGTYLFSTNSIKKGWISNNYGIFNKDIPLTYFIRNNWNISNISITNSTYKCNEIVIFTTGQLDNMSPYPSLNMATNDVDLNNVFYKNSNITYFNPTNMFYAFSVRLFVYSYTGAVFTLRRSSDDITSDFYTDNTQTYLTTGINNSGTTFTSWIGSSTAYVTKWYDQSGKDNHCTQATATIQPTLSFKNGKYVIQFNSGVGTFFNLTTASQPNTIFCHYYNTNTAYGSIIASNGDFGQRFGGNTATVINGDLNYGDWYYTQAGTKIAYNNGVSATTVFVNAWNSLALSTTSKVYTSGSFTKIGTDGYNINRGMNGYMSEMIGHNIAMTADDAIAFYNNTLNTSIILPFTITGNTNYIVSELNGYTIIKFKIGTFTVTPKTNVNIYQLFVVGGGGSGGSGSTVGLKGGEIKVPNSQNSTVGSNAINVSSNNVFTITVISGSSNNSVTCTNTTLFNLTAIAANGASGNGQLNVYTNLYYGGAGGSGGYGYFGANSGFLGGGGGSGAPAGYGDGSQGGAGGAVFVNGPSVGGGGGNGFGTTGGSGGVGGGAGGSGAGGSYASGGGGGGGGYYGGGGGGGGAGDGSYSGNGSGGGGGTGVVLLIYK